MTVCNWSERQVWELLMFLKCNPCICYPSPVTNKQFTGKTHTVPYSRGFIFSYLITHHVCLSRPCVFLCLWPVADKQRNISFVNTFGAMIFGAGLTFLFSFFFFSTVMGSPPCWACHQLAEPAGCPRTLEQYQADRASICQQPKPNRCTAHKPASQYQGLAFEMFSLTHKHKHIFTSKYKHSVSVGVTGWVEIKSAISI